jgi:hypothetical protein
MILQTGQETCPQRRFFIKHACIHNDGLNSLQKYYFVRMTEFNSEQEFSFCNRPNMLSLSDLGTATGSLERNNSISCL